MEISLKEIEELFKDTICLYIGSSGRAGNYVVGRPGYIKLREAGNYHISKASLTITQLDISNLPLERKIKISELFESRKKDELTIR